MMISSVLIIYKKSLYQLYGQERKDEQFLFHLNEDEEMKHRALVAHDENQHAIDEVQRAVENLGIPYKMKYRARKGGTDACDLVVTIGGDGTLLDASHAVVDTPMLGVNSSPSFSVGHFCSTHADGFENTLRGVIEGEQPIRSLTRLRISVDGDSNPNPVLNEVLFAHTTPGAVTRLTLHHAEEQRRYKSSGIWVSSASGSTGAIHSAGGSVMDPESTEIQYRIREPYWAPGQERLPSSGIEANHLSFTSLARQGSLYMDGHRMKARVGYGSRIEIRNDAPRLHLVSALRNAP